MSLGQSKDGVFERNTWVFVLTASWSRRVYILLYRYNIYYDAVRIKETSE